jgi:hypothetical protein
MWRVVLRVAGVLLGVAAVAAAVVAGTMFRFEDGCDMLEHVHALNRLCAWDTAIGYALVLAVVLVSVSTPGQGTWWYIASLVLAVLVGSGVSRALMETHWDAYEAKLIQCGAIQLNHF